MEIYEKDARVIVETSEGTHTAKVELDEGGLYVHVILDQGRYSDGRHRLMVSRTDVTPPDTRPMYDFNAPTEDPEIIRAVDIPAAKLVSIPEADQIDPAQPKRDYLQEALDVIQAEMDQMTTFSDFLMGRRSGLHAAISVLEGKIEQRDAR